MMRFSQFDPSETFKRGLWTGLHLDDHLRLGRDAIMDVAVWLRSLGLERYEAAFRDNGDRRADSPEPYAGGPEGNRRWSRGAPPEAPGSHCCAARRHGTQRFLRGRGGP